MPINSEVYMDKETLNQLKALAEKATPGPWKLFKDNKWLVTGKDWRLICSSRHCSFNRPSLIDTASSADNAAYIAAISPDVLLALIKENEQLRHEKDFYTRAMADYLQVAKMAWSGEIPSPLPGHTSSEEKMIEQFEYLNCPCCGGSGHVGDCSAAIQNMKCELANIQAEAENLKKEADWLAKKIIECASGECFEECVVPCESKNAEMVRESARKAVKDETNA